MEMITAEEFEKVEMRAGTIVDVKINKKARVPAYALKIDFGEYGIKTSSAQLTSLYAEADLLGRKVICCTNLVPMHIGSVKSEVRVLGLENEKGCVLLRPDMDVNNGDIVY